MSKKSSGKKEIGILLGVVLVGVAIFAIYQTFINSVQDGGFSKEVPTITDKEFYDKVANEEDFVLIYGAASCSYCQAYQPIVADVLKNDEYNDVDVYYIDVDTLDEKSKTSLSQYLDVESTPTSFLFVDGAMIDVMEGKKSVDDTKNFYDIYKSYAK